MKKIKLKIIGIIIIVTILLHSSIVIAVSSSQAQLQNEQNKIENEKKNAEAELKEVQEEKSTTVKEVEKLSNQIEDYQSQIDKLDEQISELNTKISESQENLDKAQSDYTKQEKLLETRLVAIQESGETRFLDFLLSSDNIMDLISNYYLITEITTSDAELLDKIQTQKQKIEEAKTKLEEDKQQLATSKASKSQISTQLQASKQEKNTYVAQLTDQEKQLQKEIEELKSHESSIGNRIAQMQQEYDNKNSSGNNSFNNNSNSSSSYGFGWPVSNHAIGTRFGVAGPYWSSGYHTGIDFPVSSGTAVFAVGDGKVFDTGYNSAYGNFVEIYHGNNIYSFYAHASSVYVSIGQTVSKGQQIMASGKSGNVTGAHLHFEIRTPGYKYANCVNPLNYLPN